MKKRGIIITSIVAIALIVPNPINKKVYAGVGQVAGWFTSSDSVTNKFDAGNIEIKIKENFDPPSAWNGSETKKQAWVENQSGNDELVRVAIIPRWVDEKGNPFMGNLNYVNIKYSNDPLWVDGGDGYYYFNKLLGDKEVTPHIIESVSASIPDKEKDAYKGKTLIVDVKSEAVQPTETAYKTVWTNLNSKIQNILTGLCK